MNKKGLLLINLGTPNSTELKDVRRYLKEFLSDPRVINLPGLLRYLLLYCFILPFRPKKTKEAYEKIWQNDGSPLLLHSKALAQELAMKLGEEVTVVLGMRYGKPSIAEAIRQLEEKSCNQIFVLPLFPQYSSAATGSAIEKTLKLYANKNNTPTLNIIHEFYNKPFFIQALAKVIKEQLPNDSDHLLFSYHGLPENHLDNSGCNKQYCKRIDPCPSVSQNNQSCYRAQCFATTELLAQELSFNKGTYSTSFQSRLGRTPWIKPYTDEVLPQLFAKGVRNLTIACPSFVADCLETIEEIGMQAKEQWLALGGKEFTLINCLNSDEQWLHELNSFLKDYMRLLPSH